MELWYDELQNIWDRMAKEEKCGAAWLQLQKDESDLMDLIAELEEVPDAPANPATSQGVHVTRTTAQALMTQAKNAENGADRGVKKVDVKNACADFVHALADAKNSEGVAAIVIHMQPDVLTYWVDRQKEWIEAEVVDEMMSAERARAVELWLRGFMRVKKLHSKLKDAGHLDNGAGDKEAAAFRYVMAKLQALLVNHSNADDRKGKMIGRRNKPSLMTGDGNTKITPISRAAATATWKEATDDVAA